jgi:hypothetical protein
MIDVASTLPLQHLSMRVPWHDDKWRGTICNRVAADRPALFVDTRGAERDPRREERPARTPKGAKSDRARSV